MKPDFRVMVETDQPKNLGYLDAFEERKEADVAHFMVDAGAEIDRLQRRVVELEGDLGEQQKLTEQARLLYADQRKRTEEAEAQVADQAARIDDLVWELRQAREGHAAAIEKARQEERERVARLVDGWVGCGAVAAEIRAMESQS